MPAAVGTTTESAENQQVTWSKQDGNGGGAHSSTAAKDAKEAVNDGRGAQEEGFQRSREAETGTE